MVVEKDLGHCGSEQICGSGLSTNTTKRENITIQRYVYFDNCEIINICNIIGIISTSIYLSLCIYFSKGFYPQLINFFKTNL